MEDMSPKALHNYLIERPVPLIIGPNKKLFLIDRHHLLRGLEGMRYKSDVRVFIQEDLSHLEYVQFVEAMIQKGYTYLMDENFQPIEFKDLPTHIRDLKDNVWRSIAGALRNEEAYDKPLADPKGRHIPRPFLEFILAHQLWFHFQNNRVEFIAQGIDPNHLSYEELMEFSRLMVKHPDIHRRLNDITFRWFVLGKKNYAELGRSIKACGKINHIFTNQYLPSLAPIPF